MNPSEGFWEGIGAGIGQSPWWALLGAMLIGGILFATVKYIVPANKEVRLRREDNNQKVRMRELDIREREAQNDAERIKANSALAENMRGLREDGAAVRHVGNRRRREPRGADRPDGPHGPRALHARERQAVPLRGRPEGLPQGDWLHERVEH